MKQQRPSDFVSAQHAVQAETDAGVSQDIADWGPPEAPLAMPRQQLERSEARAPRFALLAAFRPSAA